MTGVRIALRPVASVALHLRVSQEKQASEGHSLESQEETLRAWAKEEGWEVVAVYSDPGASAYRSVVKRHRFLQMIEDAEAQRFDAVLVLKLDRWARGMGVSAAFRERLERAGTRLLSYQERNAWDGTLGGFVQGSIADFIAEYYSFDLSLKVARGWETRAAKGLTLGDVPFGYERDSPREPIRPAPGERDAVLHAFREYAGGASSMARIADGLNAQGFAPRSKRGKPRFSKATVGGMLKNPIYAGFVTRHGEILGDGRHEAIVARDLFQRVQGVMTERAGKPRSYREHPAYVYLLSGVGHCARCGGPLWANSAAGGKYFYYRCAAQRRGEVCEDAGIGCRIEHLEVSVAQILRGMRLPERWQDRIQELTGEQADGGRQVEQREYWRAEIDRAKSAFKVGLLDEAEAVRMKRGAEVELEALAPLDPESCHGAGRVLTDMADAWDSLTRQERHEAVCITIKRVNVDVRKGVVVGLEPKPDFEPLFAVVAHEAGGVVRFCDWRPRADSNRRSPP